VQVEIAAGFGGACRLEVTLGFWASMREAIFSGALFRAPRLGSFTGHPKIDDFSHAWS